MPIDFNTLSQTNNKEPAPNTKPEAAAKTNFQDLLQTVAESRKDKSSPSSIKDRIYHAVHSAAEKYKLSPALILGVIKQESGFKPEARSGCGAQGLMQLMPGTAKTLGVKDSYNIEQNVDGGSKYLRQMLDRFDGDLKKAIAAYNAGPGNVAKYDGIPPFKETQAYVPAVLSHAEKFSGGKLDVPWIPTVEVAQKPLDYDLVIRTIDSAEVMSQSAASLAVSSNIQPLELPKSERSNPDPGPPPPPPPRAVRV